MLILQAYYGQEDNQDPICVKSRTGYVLTLGNCPLMWVSKLQGLVTLSTLESEYVALSTAMRDLLPTRDLLSTVFKSLGLGNLAKPLVQSNVFEDNNGALILATSKRITPRTKHIAIKYHHFWSHVGKTVNIQKIESEKNMADIFTKGLCPQKFKEIRKLLMNW